MTDALLSLGGLRPGQHGIVESLQGEHEFRARAANLGFTAGALVKMVQNHNRGPVLVSVRGTLVALGRGESNDVHVRFVASSMGPNR